MSVFLSKKAKVQFSISKIKNIWLGEELLLLTFFDNINFWTPLLAQFLSAPHSPFNKRSQFILNMVPLFKNLYKNWYCKMIKINCSHVIHLPWKFEEIFSWVLHNLKKNRLYWFHFTFECILRFSKFQDCISMEPIMCNLITFL